MTKGLNFIRRSNLPGPQLGQSQNKLRRNPRKFRTSSGNNLSFYPK